MDVLWKAINDIIIKTMILVHPYLYQNYKLCRALKSEAERESVCFEILGFDFLVDRDMKPWLLKVLPLQCKFLEAITGCCLVLLWCYFVVLL